MPKNRPIPAIVVGLLLIATTSPSRAQAPPDGQAPAGTAPGQAGGTPSQAVAMPTTPAASAELPPTDAEKALDEAIARLRATTSFSADIEQAVDMLSQKFEVKGVYLKAEGHRVYLKLTVSGLGDASATTLQACDGTTLWDFQQVLDTQSYRKYMVNPIFAKLADPVLDAAIRDQVTTSLGFAGPEAMLIGLRKKVRFNQKADETLDGKKVWVIRGEWKDRSDLTGPNQQPLPATAQLPPYIPSNIGVWVGQDDGCPYQVEMYGNALSMLPADTRRIGPDGRPMGAKVAAPKVDPSKITLRYTNVKLNPTLAPESFAFQPPAGAKGVVDGTDNLLENLDRAIQIATSMKKAEEAKSEAVLPGGLDLPKQAAPPTSPSPIGDGPAPPK